MVINTCSHRGTFFFVFKKKNLLKQGFLALSSVFTSRFVAVFDRMVKWQAAVDRCVFNHCVYVFCVHEYVYACALMFYPNYVLPCYVNLLNFEHTLLFLSYV